MKKLRIFTLVLSLMMVISGIGTVTPVIASVNSAPITTSKATPIPTKKPTTTPTKKPSSTQLNVHFIDVGQGDATLIESNGHFMLIDAGENDQAQTVISYLKDAGVKKLDYVIGTHPHSDHIGGLDKVIGTFKIGKIILPPIEHTTKTFEDVLDAIDNKNLKITKPVVGNSYKIGDAEFIILAPNKDYGDDLNDWLIGIKLSNGKNSFVFTGDAEFAEKDILDNGIDLSAHVFHAGHHGSSTSNSNELLAAVKPSYIVISCGKDNSYGHPHKEVLDAIKKLKATTYRTDKDGTVIASSNGKTITWTKINGNSTKTTATPKPTIKATPKPTKKPTATPTVTPTKQPTKVPEKTVTVHITKTGEKYHSAGCQYLSKSNISVSLKDAKASGYDPCSRCNPPR